MTITDRNEALSHVVSSAKYWAGDTIDNSYYTNNVGLEKAFKLAVKHVKNSHDYELNEDDIKHARSILGLN